MSCKFRYKNRNLHHLEVSNTTVKKNRYKTNLVDILDIKHNKKTIKINSSKRNIFCCYRRRETKMQQTAASEAATGEAANILDSAAVGSKKKNSLRRNKWKFCLVSFQFLCLFSEGECVWELLMASKEIDIMTIITDTKFNRAQPKLRNDDKLHINSNIQN